MTVPLAFDLFLGLSHSCRIRIRRMLQLDSWPVNRSGKLSRSRWWTRAASWEHLWSPRSHFARSRLHPSWPSCRLAFQTPGSSRAAGEFCALYPWSPSVRGRRAHGFTRSFRALMAVSCASLSGASETRAIGALRRILPNWLSIV